MKETKIIITGVGGQGVVFLTNILVEAAVKAGIPVATSEIHGLSQRGGSVTAGLTFGDNTFGFVEEGGADFVLGLELLETQRSISYLNKNSTVVVDNTKIYPHSVNAEKATYPETDLLINWLKENIKETVFVTDEGKDFTSVMRNLLVLGYAAAIKDFPVGSKFIAEAIRDNSRGDAVKSVAVFNDAYNSCLSKK